MQASDLFVENGVAMCHYSIITPKRDATAWYTIEQQGVTALSDLDVVLMRKDPPFDINYVYTTHILSLAQSQGCLVVNDPQSLRDFNEKLFISAFPQCCAPTLISSQLEPITTFIEGHDKVVCKPLGGMGGKSIFVTHREDNNRHVIIETLTEDGKTPIMVQRYIEDIRHSGDKRILIVNGEPIPYALARIPKAGDNRGNLAAGGRAEGRPLTDRDRWICTQVSPTLVERGLLFVGIDVIGDYLTEINVTSPTCVRELDEYGNMSISAQLFDALEGILSQQ